MLKWGDRHILSEPLHTNFYYLFRPMLCIFQTNCQLLILYLFWLKVDSTLPCALHSSSLTNLSIVDIAREPHHYLPLTIDIPLCIIWSILYLGWRWEPFWEIRGLKHAYFSWSKAFPWSNRLQNDQETNEDINRSELAIKYISGTFFMMIQLTLAKSTPNIDLSTIFTIVYNHFG